MRAKILIAILGAGVAVGLVFLLRQPASVPTDNQSVEQAAATEPAASANETVIPPAAKAKQAELSSTNAAAPTGIGTETPDETPEARQEAYKSEMLVKLADLGMNDDSDSLNSILNELGNRDPEIRLAALEATKQFGSRDAIPKLMDAASQTDDSQERAAIYEAIEFLKLPSLTEVMQQNAAQPAGGANGR
jgi:HEAT repeat protein